MKKLNCRRLQIVIPFEEKVFQKIAFKKDTSRKQNDHYLFFSHHISKNKRKNEHSHIDIQLDGDDSELTISFHPNKIHLEGDYKVSEIPLEECVSWVSNFFEDSIFLANFSTIFEFEAKSELLIKIDYPLLVDSELLENAIVCGHEIEFSNESLSGRFLITSNKRGSFVALFNGVTDIDISEFNLYSEIDRLSSYIRALFRNQEND